jgi:hypothetical protein
MAYSIHNIYPKAFERPGEAEQIETARKRLVLRSEKARIGKDRFPGLTVHRLAQTALYLASSNASTFERVHTLNTTEANFRARNLDENSLRIITRLSQRALQEAFPPTDDPATDDLNRLDLLARRRAIGHTTPNISFAAALDEAWTYLGHPMEPLLRRTERVILYGDFLEQTTGAVDNHSDDGTNSISLLK